MARAVAIIRRVCSIETIEIDALLDESHQLKNTLTDHPVEEGFNVTDHSRPDPDMVTLRCFISNTPLTFEQQTRTIREGSASFETRAVAGTQLHDVNGRGNQAFIKLKKLRDEGTLIKIVTTLKIYESNATEGMGIESINISRTSSNYDGLEFTIMLKQVQIVRNKQRSNITKKDTRTGQKNKKGQQTKKAPANKDRAPLVQLFESGQSVDNSTISGVSNFVLSGGSGGQSVP